MWRPNRLSLLPELVPQGDEHFKDVFGTVFLIETVTNNQLIMSLLNAYKVLHNSYNT